MVRIIFGNYQPDLKKDIVSTKFNPDSIHKNPITGDMNIVLFVESLGMTKSDIEHVKKNATANVILVAIAKKSIPNAKKSKNVTIEYKEYVEAMNPFQLAMAFLNIKDRNYLFNFLTINKPYLFIAIKALMSNHRMLSKHNQTCLKWIDAHLYYVKPEIIYAFIAHIFKPDYRIRFLKWNYPKAEEN